MDFKMENSISKWENIDRASKMTDTINLKENTFASIFQSLVGRDTSSGGVQGVSGIVEGDYPPLLEKVLIPRKQFTLEYHTPIPPDLKEILRQGEDVKCKMGLFPTIHKAWMVIGSDIYLWDSRDGSDLSFYDGLIHTINEIEMIPAKPKVFQSGLSYILCVTTSEYIYLLGFITKDEVGFDGTLKTTVEVIAQPLYKISTEDVSFDVIKGTSNGRIFLGGNDGYIYEVFYQAERSWIGDKCWKKNMTRSILSYLPKFLTLSANEPIQQIVVDNNRNILFSLSKGGRIECYDLGEPGSDSKGSFSCLASLSSDVIMNSCIVASKKSLESSLLRKIVDIAAIEHGEFNLVAVTESGTRLYFTCLSNPMQNLTGSLTYSTPSTLQLVHIRLPPGYTPTTTFRKPTTVETSHVSNNVYVASCSGGRDCSILWIVTPFLYPTGTYAEVVSIHTIPGKTLEIVERINSSMQQEIHFEAQEELKVQHLPYRKDLLILTNQGTLLLRFSKPYEILKDLMLERNGIENIKAHFECVPNRIQPLINALLVAVHPNLFSDPNIPEMAGKALYLYGGGSDSGAISPEKITSPRLGLENRFSRGSMSNSIPTSPHSPFQGTGGGRRTPYPTPQQLRSSPQRSNPQPTRQTQQQAQFQQPVGAGIPHTNYWPYSHRHDALYAQAGRFLGNFWNDKLLKAGIIEGTNTRIIVPNVRGEQAACAAGFLRALHTFMTNNPTFYMPSTTTFSSDLLGRPFEAKHQSQEEIQKNQAYEMEKASMGALKTFLSHCVEVLGMWALICEHQVHVILEGVDERLLNVTMKDLIIQGQEIVSVILNSLISKYLHDDGGIDDVTLRLRETCPTLFRSEDAVCSKVSEILRKGKFCKPGSVERDELIEEALRLALQVASSIGRADLRNFCLELGELGYPLGAVRLVDAVGKFLDPQRIASNSLKGTTGRLDASSAKAYAAKCDIYKIVFEVLDLMCSRKEEDEDEQGEVDDALGGILDSDDEVFHTLLYNWLLDKNQFEKILHIQHPYLERFLARAAEGGSIKQGAGRLQSMNDIKMMDLLWRHYELNKAHHQAAQILQRLADSSPGCLSFKERLEFLARANICAKSGSRHGLGDELETLEDKLEVARVQESIINVLQGKRTLAASSQNTSFDRGDAIPGGIDMKSIQDALQKLDSQLFTITELFTEFAEPLKLPEIKLEIFYVAQHVQQQLIEGCYADIVEAEINAVESMEVQLEMIRKKIIALGRKYFPSGTTFFPLEYLVEHLECMLPYERVDHSWVMNIMLDVGVPFGELLTVYENFWGRVIRGKERSSFSVSSPTSGSNIGNSPTSPETGDADTIPESFELRLTRVLMTLIQFLVSGTTAHSSQNVHMNELIEKCRGILSRMIVEFSSKFDQGSIQLNSCLTSLKDELDRF